jgi:hypothetical protein
VVLTKPSDDMPYVLGRCAQFGASSDHKVGRRLGHLPVVEKSGCYKSPIVGLPYLRSAILRARFGGAFEMDRAGWRPFGASESGCSAQDYDDFDIDLNLFWVSLAEP